MFKLFKNSFKVTNDCIILATPLIIFLSILGWYFGYASDSVDNIPKLVLAIITIFVMTSGFFAAWFYMCKKTLKLTNKVFIFDKDRTKAFWNLILSLPRGIGKLFLPFLGILLIETIIYSLVIGGASYLIFKCMGPISIDLLDTNIIFLSSKELINELKELPQNELLTINCLYFVIMGMSFLINFITMLWIPEVVYSEKNPIKALIYAIKKLRISFSKSLCLYLYINILWVVITILNTILMINPISYFVVLLLYYYFIVYLVVLLFNYYEQTFLKDE